MIGVRARTRDARTSARCNGVRKMTVGSIACPKSRTAEFVTGGRRSEGLGLINWCQLRSTDDRKRGLERGGHRVRRVTLSPFLKTAIGHSSVQGSVSLSGGLSN